MTDVSNRAHLGPGRRAEPLTEPEQNRLRTLTGKSNRTAQEQFELGALRARGRASQQGRRVLSDLAHDRAASGGRRGGVTARQVGEALGAAIVAGVERALDDLDYDDAYGR